MLGPWPGFAGAAAVGVWCTGVQTFSRAVGSSVAPAGRFAFPGREFALGFWAGNWFGVWAVSTSFLLTDLTGLWRYQGRFRGRFFWWMAVRPAGCVLTHKTSRPGCVLCACLAGGSFETFGLRRGDSGRSQLV